MTRDDVIHMAIEAGLFAVSYPHPTNSKEVERFAHLVAAAEREACAKGCEASVAGFGAETDWANGYIQAAKDIAEGIRARGNQ